MSETKTILYQVNNRKTYKLGDIANITTGFPFKGDLYSKNGIRVLRGENIGDEELRWDGHRDKRWNLPFERINEYSLQDGDVILAMDGNVGKNKARITDKDLPMLIAQRVACIRANTLSDQKFLYYAIISRAFQQYLDSVKTGTTIQHISMKQIADYEISLPGLEEQRRIAGILGAIDDKIENNRRINTNLETQAQALYKQWFVDNRSDDWESKKLSNFFNVVTGKKDANFSTKDGVYPFFTCSQDVLKAPDYSFEGAAILLAGNGDFNVKRYIGKFEAYQRTYVLIPFDRKYHSFLYLTIKHYLQEITGGSRGSVIKFITKGNIADFEIALPQENIDDKLAVLDSIYQTIDRNTAENHNLATLRDTLLPKLMNGEMKTE